MNIDLKNCLEHSYWHFNTLIPKIKSKLYRLEIKIKRGKKQEVNYRKSLLFLLGESFVLQIETTFLIKYISK